MNIIGIQCGDQDKNEIMLGLFLYYALKYSYFDFQPISVTHLANQHYKACIRRGNGKEIICYIACTHIVGASGATAGGSVTSQVIFMNFAILKCHLNILN